MDDKQPPTQQSTYTDLTGLEAEVDMIGLDYQYYMASPFFAGFKNFGSPDWKIFLGIYTGLSPNIKNFIAAPETAQSLFQIGQNNGLEEKQIYLTAQTLRDLLLGHIFIKDLPSQLAQKIGIDETKSNQVINQIVSQLFSPIIDDVKRIQRSKFPDRISQMQKESQPTGLTQPGAKPVSPRPEVEPRKQPEVQPQRPEDRPQGQAESTPKIEVKPQLTPPSSAPYTYSTPQNMRPMPQMPPPPIQRPVPKLEVKPQAQLPRPQFKVPDLSGIKIPASTPSGKAEDSLEKELEQVANIIDLRNKPPEK